MKMHEFGCTSAAQDAAKIQALETGHGITNDPKDDTEFTREEVMKELQAYLTASSDLGIPPLPLLREKFPGYTWQWFPEVDKEIVEILCQRDFIWVCCWEQVITAVKNERGDTPPRAMCFIDESGLSIFLEPTIQLIMEDKRITHVVAKS